MIKTNEMEELIPYMATVRVDGVVVMNECPVMVINGMFCVHAQVDWLDTYASDDYRPEAFVPCTLSENLIQGIKCLRKIS